MTQEKKPSMTVQEAAEIFMVKEYNGSLEQYAVDNFITGADWQAKEGWIDVKERKPEIKEGEDFSENVLAWCNDKLMVMAYVWINMDEYSGYGWCNCYGNIQGYGEYDDEYYPTHWMPLPAPPQSKTIG